MCPDVDRGVPSSGALWPRCGGSQVGKGRAWVSPWWGLKRDRLGAGDMVWGDRTQWVPVPALRTSPCHPGSTLP